jgi:hypothetical protein
MCKVLLVLILWVLPTIGCTHHDHNPGATQQGTEAEEVAPPENLPPRSDRVTTPQRPHTTCPNAMAGSC